MRKFRNAKTGVMMLAAILAISGCGKTKQETTTQPKVYVSEEQVETEVTAITTTEPISETTTLAETTQAVINDNSEWGKVDEIYNTNFAPNVTNDVTLEVALLRNDNYNGTYWKSSNSTDEHIIEFNDNMNYYEFSSITGYEIMPIEDIYSIDINEEDVTYNRDEPTDYAFKFCGIHHIPLNNPLADTDDIYKSKLYAPLIIELADRNGNIADIVKPSEEYRVKAIGSTSDYSSIILKYVIQTDGDTLEVIAGDRYNDVSHKLYKMLEGIDIDMDIDSNNQSIVIKNEHYTLFIERNEHDEVGSIMLINNNV